MTKYFMSDGEIPAIAQVVFRVYCASVALLRKLLLYVQTEKPWMQQISTADHTQMHTRIFVAANSNKLVTKAQIELRRCVLKSFKYN